LVLPDGSRVWLNAASSIRYPTAFSGSRREVEITGEVYLEVAPDARRTFAVHTNGLTIDVLGTSFDVNAYADEAVIRTTLLSGAVKIADGTRERVLRPGDQAEVSKGGDIKVTDQVDVDQVMGWKDGYFTFNNTDLATVMREISRWYDVDIVYAGKVPDRKFGGAISRNNNASEVLKVLEESKVSFRIEGKKIIVLP
jgi:ferric-dicitrate binding protein FerR (iron transport regulator)